MNQCCLHAPAVHSKVIWHFLLWHIMESDNDIVLESVYVHITRLGLIEVVERPPNGRSTSASA